MPALGSEECGQNIIEYSLIVALVAFASVAAISGVGQAAIAIFTAVGTRISSAV